MGYKKEKQTKPLLVKYAEMDRLKVHVWVFLSRDRLTDGSHEAFLPDSEIYGPNVYLSIFYQKHMGATVHMCSF